MAGTGLAPALPAVGPPDAARWRAEMIAGGLRARAHLRRPARAARVLRGARLRRARCSPTCPPGVDPCGENGEFHTFAWDGPMFRQPVPVRGGEVVERDGFVFADLLPERAIGDALAGGRVTRARSSPSLLLAGAARAVGGAARRSAWPR